MNWLVPLVVLVPLIGAAGALAIGRGRGQAAVALVALVGTLGVSIALLVVVDAGGPLAMSVGGWPVPVGIVLVVDRLSALLLVVSAIVLLGVFLFSLGQGLADGTRDTPVSIYFPAYLILAAGVMTAFVAGDLFNLYVAFEILLVASYVLITLGGTEARIRTGTTYIVVSLVSSILFLAAIAIIYGATGTVNLAQLSERIVELPLSIQTLLHVLLLIGFAIKAAVFPLSFWLPDSYPTAPAPVTAVFAGLLTKVGIYAIIRTETLLFPQDGIDPVLLVVASATLLVGILGAIAQTDLKRLLSFTLVSHIGYLMLGVGLGTIDAMTATIYYIVHHIVVQTSLFLVAGLIERFVGTTSIPRIGGMLRAAPLIAALFLISALNLGGIPPFSGFLGKVGIFRAAIEQGTVLALVGVGVGTLVSLLTLYALIRVWSSSFWRPTPVEDAATGGTPTGDAGRQGSAADGATATRTVTRAEARTGTSATGTRWHVDLMTASTAALVTVGVALTVFAGPLYQYSERAAEGIDAGSYVAVVEGIEGGER